MDTGAEKIEDAETLTQVQQQARKVINSSIVWSVVLTLVVALMPI